MPDGTPDFISDSLKFGINLGLERITALMDLLGNPQKNLKCVHVAGTNGKGSVCATLGTIMACAGKKVGLFTSPFIERFSERMRILDGREGLSKFENDDTEGEIPDDTLQRLSDVVKNATDKLVGNGMEHPTEFELVTAICFLWFAEEKVDIAILEVGLGGLYDSTNIIEHPVCTVITSIGKDHTDRLGDTVGEIAFQKAGILKPGSPLVLSDPFMSAGNTSEEKSEIKKTIEKSAKELDVPVTVAGDEKSIDSCRADENYNMLFEYSGKTFKTKLLGFHQVLNIETAIEAAKVVGVDEDTIGEGVERTSWKCRMEVLSQKPLVVLDGGHNPQGAQVLSDTLFGLLKIKKVRLLMGVMGDKDLDGILDAYKEFGPDVEFCITTRPDNPRSMDPLELSRQIKLVYNNVDIKVIEDPGRAARAAFADSGSDGLPLVVTGSLYLMGSVRPVLKGLV